MGNASPCSACNRYAVAVSKLSFTYGAKGKRGAGDNISKSVKRVKTAKAIKWVKMLGVQILLSLVFITDNQSYAKFSQAARQLVTLNFKIINIVSKELFSCKMARPNVCGA